MIGLPIRPGRTLPGVLAACLAVLALYVAPLNAQRGGVSDAAQAEQAKTWADSLIEAEGYVRPPQEILDAVLAPRYTNVTFSNPSPDRKYFMRTESEGMPSLASFAKKHYNLAGLWIDPVASRARNMTTRGSVGVSVTDWETGEIIEIQTPEGATVSSPSWSPDGSRLAFLANFDDATYVYTADPATGRSRRLNDTPLLAVFVDDYEWVADGEGIVVVVRPQNRAPEPPDPMLPETPKVRVTEDAENRLRTYADLLETPHEMELLEYHTTGQLAVINVQNGRLTRIGQPDMIRSVSPSPDGQYFRITRMIKPFSYIVPVSNFGSVEEIIDRSGAVVMTLNESELRTGAGGDGGGGGRGGRGGAGDDNGRRNLSWYEFGQGMTFLQFEPAAGGARGQNDAAAAGAGRAGRGGRGGGRAGGRAGAAGGAAGGAQQAGIDRLMQWLPPFDSTSTNVLYENQGRMNSVRWSEDGEMLFITEGQGASARTSAVYLSEPGTKYTVQQASEQEDDEDAFYNDQGSLMGAGGGGGGRGGRGGRGGGGGGAVRVSTDHGYVYMQGTKYFENPLEQAPQVFIDRVAIRTGERSRLYTAPNDGVNERVGTVLDDDLNEMIVIRESPTQVPNSYLRNNATGQLRQLTDNTDYTPDITNAQRQRVLVTRADGFSFKVDVTLPQSWQQGQKLPAIFWFYPREYTDQESYDRGNRSYNKNQFPNLSVRSMDILVRLGYAVVEPDAPIVGEDGRMNDNYEHDLRNDLSATIDALDAAGMVDRTRLAVGGHSYGAFSTANAMVNTPFFKAGIAGDGNYNRTLTPLGFQTERRILWEAPQVYIGMSPFFQADKLTGALLMYHGMDDQNVGTDPINSERMFHALNGLGKPAALYMYPFEDHGYATEETTLDLWARWTAWLEKYVKNANATSNVTTDISDEAGN